jgi:hypothetical protein
MIFQQGRANEELVASGSIFSALSSGMCTTELTISKGRTLQSENDQFWSPFSGKMLAQIVAQNNRNIPFSSPNYKIPHD